jgi:outer membrane biosynthesis protein TonB
LDLDTASLGQSFLSLAESNKGAPMLIADKPLPFPRPEFVPTNAPAVTRSQVRFEGEVARRSLLSPLTLPPQTNSDVLTNTVVQVLVDAGGDVQSRALLSSSGSSEADGVGLRLAANARFELVAPAAETGNPFSRVTWGKMIFQWQTVPRPATNGFPAAP